MKKMIWLIFILLTSCIPAPAILSPVSTNPPPVPIGSSFTYNSECPHVCFLGISPGVTTAEEAKNILSSSKQIDKNFYAGYDGFRAKWLPDSTRSLPIRVDIVVENGVAQKLVFYFPGTVKIQEIVDPLGKPDEISIRKEQTAEAPYINYVVYYTSAKALIFAYVPMKDESGPSPNDSIDVLYLNINPDDPNLPKRGLELKEFRQPWLGFGHLEEYLLHNTPTPTNPSAP